ncbi:hypothetical protein HERIO_2201 [Hepatospora eriocheir]|uniref:Uncharacterized protein n=1 Tax=Hepatospora eriocheir TaxID=1081669 RepID=A0A1X0Q7T2_9MICR|nr:hypothetical protein HERIO_2201 [Hepatospora eriocheir]
MSIKTCLKSFINSQNTGYILCFKITKYDIFCLITFTIIFILSLYVKFIRDILVNVILSVFYSMILSLLISIIYYGRNDSLNRLKILLSDKDVLDKDGKIGIEYIFMSCFILYLTTIFFTWRLFWKKENYC